jgi:uncharacterized circularly permuted ATP-grasp superfamily protein/uncharacterized alpha-E superfamily protein
MLDWMRGGSARQAVDGKASMHKDKAAPWADAPESGPLYQPLSGVYDAMMTADGEVRPEWRPWYDAVAGWSARHRREQGERLNRIVRDKGVAYDPFADPSETEQPWFIDLAPLVISPTEWAFLQQALEQRARLMAAIYDDLYGPQMLLAGGHLPAQLVFSDPSFLRALHGIERRREALTFYAADLARDASGEWRVIDNHAETPAGIGFAIANRIVATHVLGGVFRNSNAIRLASHFQALQQILVARSGVEDPQIAVLTPGPTHRDYFSHSFLARYLGYSLVEGGDLVVVNNQVRLKTLEGLKPLNVIIRCIEGAQADPLELNPRGFEGTAGMVRAARSGENLIVNQLGTSIVENRGLAAFLPGICRHLLGEELMLREAPRWWLGDPAIADHVLGRLPELMISDAHEGSGRPGEARRSVDGAQISNDGLTSLRDKIALYGASLVAEEKANYATSPSWNGTQLQPRACAVRFYAQLGPKGYEVMPGGLSMSVGPNANIGLYSPEGLTRDVWIVSDQPQGPFESLWQGSEAVILPSRTGRALQSRVADNLFWLGCYAERMEATLRLCRQALSRIEEDSGPPEDATTVIEALDIIIAKDPGAAIGEHGFGSSSDIERRVRTLVYGKGRGYGFQSSLAHLQRIAGQTRDRLSSEAWRILSHFFSNSQWRRDPEFSDSAQMLDFVEQGLMTLAAFSGMAMENMTRNFGWRFLDMGRRIERSQTIAELMLRLSLDDDGKVASSQRLMFILEVADSFITYRSRYRIMPALPAVIDLLLLDETNPRALAFQLAMLTEHINKLPKEPEVGQRSEESRIVLDLLSQLRLADMEGLARAEGGTEMPLLSLLRRCADRLPRLVEVLSQRYFTHTAEKSQRI